MKSKISLDYVAGIFDGEGCVTITKTKKAACKNITYEFQCAVVNTNEWLCRMLQFMFGGCVVLHPAKGNQRDCWAWQIRAIKAYNFLKTIQPYVILKRPQVDLAIDFHESKSKYGKYPLTDEELAIREAQYILSGKLKRV